MINWSKLSTGKTSDELVDVVINEITHGNTDGYLDKNFQGRLNMRRRNTGLLIKEIWEHRVCFPRLILLTFICDLILVRIEIEFEIRGLCIYLFE